MLRMPAMNQVVQAMCPFQVIICAEFRTSQVGACVSLSISHDAPCNCEGRAEGGSGVQGPHAAIKVVLIAVSILWSMHATVPFTSGSVPSNRNILAVYPLALMYAVLGWLIFVTT